MKNVIIILSTLLVVVSYTSGSSHWRFPDKARGINTNSKAFGHSLRESQEFIKTIVRWNANILRINLKHTNREYDPKNPLSIFEDTFRQIDAILPLCNRKKLSIIISLNYLTKAERKYFFRKNGMIEYRKEISIIWKEIVKKYKNEPSIVAYDLFNEPSFKLRDGYIWYEEVLPVVIKNIRKIDKDIPLIVEPGPWGTTKGFRYLEKLDDDNIIYSFHHYKPNKYTHQGIKRFKNSGELKYPGYLQEYNRSPMKYWDKITLRESMREAIYFQKKYNVRILVGEFGVARWALGREQWVKDSIDIFEELGWDWCFHSYGAWNGWNHTFGTDAPRSTKRDGGQKTKVIKILQEYLKINK